jgi:hypothetical protein
LTRAHAYDIVIAAFQSTVRASMSTHRNRFLLSALLLLATALAAPLTRAHAPDPLAGAAGAPAPNAAPESVSGTVHELVVDDRVAGLTLRYLSLRPASGDPIALAGPGVETLRDGAVAQIVGRRNGQVLFVESARAVGAKAASPAVTDATTEGELRIAHADDFATGSSRYLYDVRAKDGAVTRLALGTRPEALQAGMRVAVHGKRVGAADIDPARIEILALAPASASTGTGSDTTGTAAKATATHSVLVILMSFSNTATDPLPVSSVQNVMVNASNSVANFFREVSYGQHALNVTVTNRWLRSTMATPANCDYTTLGNAAEQAAVAGGYSPTSYEFRVYVFPMLSSCGWSGLAYIGNPKKAWINGGSAVVTNVIGHEMGHNFGLLHAASLDCGARATGGSCTSSEYGDPFNTMGNARAMHYDAAQKARLGWIPGSSVVTHSSGSATYQLAPLETAGAAAYALKIPAASNRTYWLEYRRPVGFDAPLASYPNAGAQLRLASPFESMCPGCGAYSIDTQFLDMTPGTSAMTDGSLVAGQSFTDSDYGFTINVISATASALTVQVSGPGSSKSSSSTALASSANPAPAGTSVTFTATVTGSSPTGSVAFTDNGATVSGCGAVALAGSGNARMAKCSTTALASGTHTVVARYAGDALNNASTSASLSQSITSVSAPPPGSAVNVALASAGAVASASSTMSGYDASHAINGRRTGTRTSSDLWWLDNNNGVFPDWLEVRFAGKKTLSSVVVYSLSDTYLTGTEPTGTTPALNYGLRDFTVQGWNGSAWITLGTVTGNTLAKRTVTFASFSTDRIRLSVTNASSGWSRVVELEAWGN